MMPVSTSLRTLVAIGLLATIACEEDRPAVDDTPPVVTIAVEGGRGDNTFSTADGPLPVGEDCVKVAEGPVRLALGVTDSGGVVSAAVGVSFGTIFLRSLELVPGPPESSVSFTSEPGGDNIVITLTPPSPGTVRTTLAATLEFEPRATGSVIGAGATDSARNSADLQPIGVHLLGDGILCQGLN